MRKNPRGVGTKKEKEKALVDAAEGRKSSYPKNNGGRLLFNTFNTNYPIIDLAAKGLGFKTVCKDHNLVPSAELRAAHKLSPNLYSTIYPEEFDVVWFDLTITGKYWLN